jgi:integrase
MRLSDRGEELVTVAEILGHTDIRITDRYPNGMQERKREALEKLVSFASVQCDAEKLKKKNGRVRALP